MKYSKELHDWVKSNNVLCGHAGLPTVTYTTEVITALLDEIDRLNAERRWIPVSQLPTEKQRVIILLKSGDVSNTVFEDGWFAWDEGIPYRPGAVKGWMPLPPAPESEGE